MKKNPIYLIIIFLCFFYLSKGFANGSIEVKKLYDLYSKDILDIAQLNSAFDKIGVDKENMGNLFSLKKEEIISEEDFINGINKIIENKNTTINDKDKNISSQETSDLIFNKEYSFQTKIINLSQYIVGDLSYGELLDNKIVFSNNKISSIYLKQNGKELVKFSKPKLKILNDNKFTIKSNIIDPTDPAAPLRYILKGIIENNKIKGTLDISYFGNDLPSGTVLIKAETNL
tara:strand:- start:509 stop:1201 length:693 start_codon:yes stop_codon:yes gene_type:complete